MTEYIEREAVVQYLLKCADGYSYIETPTEQTIKAVNAIPAADVVPVRHGRWIVSRIDYSWVGTEFPTHCKCDQCGKEVPYQDRDNYCPRCGALMDKDGDGE